MKASGQTKEGAWPLPRVLGRAAARGCVAVGAAKSAASPRAHTPCHPAGPVSVQAGGRPPRHHLAAGCFGCPWMSRRSGCYQLPPRGNRGHPLQLVNSGRSPSPAHTLYRQLGALDPGGRLISLRLQRVSRRRLGPADGAMGSSSEPEASTPPWPWPAVCRGIVCRQDVQRHPGAAVHLQPVADQRRGRQRRRQRDVQRQRARRVLVAGREPGVVDPRRGHGRWQRRPKRHLLGGSESRRGHAQRVDHRRRPDAHREPGRGALHLQPRADAGSDRQRRWQENVAVTARSVARGERQTRPSGSARRAAATAPAPSRTPSPRIPPARSARVDRRRRPDVHRHPGRRALHHSLSPAQAPISSGGGRKTIAVTAPIGCPWQATSQAFWISTTSSNGPGTVAYSVAPNPARRRAAGRSSSPARSFTVIQDPAPVSTASRRHMHVERRRRRTIAVTAPSGCPGSDEPRLWINTTSSEQLGSGTFVLRRHRYRRHPGAAGRSSATQTFTVARPRRCTYAVSPTGARCRRVRRERSLA